MCKINTFGKLGFQIGEWVVKISEYHRDLEMSMFNLG